MQHELDSEITRGGIKKLSALAIKRCFRMLRAYASLFRGRGAQEGSSKPCQHHEPEPLAAFTPKIFLDLALKECHVTKACTGPAATRTAGSEILRT